MLDEVNRINMLYDIYHPLLTERQRDALKLYFSDNFSLGEIALDFGTSRQAVYDLIRRALATIDSFEEKLGLYNLFDYQQERLLEAERILQKPGACEKDRARLKELIGQLLRMNEQ